VQFRRAQTREHLLRKIKFHGIGCNARPSPTYGG
jgi:hypothetical protein